MPKTKTPRRGEDYDKYSVVRKGLEADIRRSKKGSESSKLSGPDRAANTLINEGLGKLHNKVYEPEGKKCGGKVKRKKMARGGGIEIRGKTKGRFI